MQPLPGYQDLFPILPSFQHAPRLQIRAAFISPIAETPDIHTPSIRQHVMRSQNQAPFVLYTIFLTPLLGIPYAIFLAIGGICRNSQWDYMPSPKRENPSTDNCFKTFAHLHDGAAVWSTWQARNVLLFCSLEDRPRASAWLGGSCLRPTFLRPLLY